jgi:hypothetical protein
VDINAQTPVLITSRLRRTRYPLRNRHGCSVITLIWTSAEKRCSGWKIEWIKKFIYLA